MVNLPIDTYLVTPGAWGMAVKILPPCPTGEAALVMYQDTSYAQSIDEGTFYAICHSYYGGVPVVQFVCKEVAGGSITTSTTTATFGKSATPVVGGAATPVFGEESQPTSPISNNALPTSKPSSSSTFPGSSHTGYTINSDDTATSGSGLSHNAQVMQGVGIPVAALFIAIMAWQFPRRMRRYEKPGQNVEQAPLPNLPYQSNMNLQFNTSD